jgi:hypothetical protein
MKPTEKSKEASCPDCLQEMTLIEDEGHQIKYVCENMKCYIKEVIVIPQE